MPFGRNWHYLLLQIYYYKYQKTARFLGEAGFKKIFVCDCNYNKSIVKKATSTEKFINVLPFFRKQQTERIAGLYKPILCCLAKTFYTMILYHEKK